jgi:hypothetical protein
MYLYAQNVGCIRNELHLIALKHPALVHLRAVRSFPEINLLELCVLYIGRAYRYAPDVAFYIYFFQKL